MSSEPRPLTISPAPPGRNRQAGGESALYGDRQPVAWDDSDKVPRQPDGVPATLDVGRNTKRMYVGYLRKHVRPLVGHVKAGALDADALDSLYAELRRCRSHCDGRGGIDHRTPRPDECDEGCRAHACRPLAKPLDLSRKRGATRTGARSSG
jgi:hypothetical protein